MNYSSIVKGVLSVSQFLFENVNKLISKKGVFTLSTMIGLYLIRKFVSSAFYFGYFSGFISCVVFEIVFSWEFLAYKMRDKLRTSKSIFEIAKFIYEKAFEEEPFEKKLNDAKGKGYFINNFSSETKMIDYSNKILSKTQNPNSKVRPESNISSGTRTPITPSTLTNEPDLKLAKSLLIVNNKKEDYLSRFDPDNIDSAPVLLKIHSEEFIKKVNKFTAYLNELILFEETYAKSLQLVGEPKFLSSEKFLFSTKESSLFQSVSKSDLSEEQLKLLGPYFSTNEAIASLEVSMPEWKIFKKAINQIGRIHSDCANFLRDGSNSLINMMSIEYVNNCKEINRQRKLVSDEMQSYRSHYNKVKNEYDSTEEAVKILSTSYLETKKKKGIWEEILNIDHQLKLTLGKLNSVKAKLDDAKDKLKECYRKANNMNLQIEEFENHWEEIRVKYFTTTLRGMISGYENTFLDTKILLEEIVNFKFLIEKPTGSPKSFLKALSLHPERDLDDQRTKPLDLQTKLSISEKLEKKNSRYSFGENSVNIEQSADINDSKQQIEKLRLSSSDIPLFLRNQKAEISMKNEEDKELMKFVEAEILKHINEVYDRISSWYEEQNSKLLNFEKFYKGAALLFKELVGFEESHRHNLYYKFNAGEMLNKESGQLLFVWKNFKFKMGMCTDAIKIFIKNLKSLETQCYTVIKRLEKERTTHYSTCEIILKKYNAFIRKLHKEHSDKLAKIKKEKFHEETHFVNADLNRVCIKEKNLFEAEMTVHLFKSNDILNENNSEMAKIKASLVAYLISYNAHQLKAVSELISKVDADYQSESSVKDDGMGSDLGTNDLGGTRTPLEELSKPGERNSVIIEKKEENVREEEIFHEFDQEINFIKNNKFDMEELLNEDFMDNLTLLEPMGKGGCACITRLFGVFFDEWSRNHYFKEKMKNELNESFNKKRPSALGEIQVIKLELDGVGPEIRDIFPQKSEPFEFLYDLDISYRGKINLEIVSEVQFNWFSANYSKFPLDVEVLIQSLNGKIRVCYVPTRYGKSWYSFIGEPVIHIAVDPKIGKMSINKFPQVCKNQKAPDIIKDHIQKKIKKMTYPNRVTLKIPVAKVKNLKPKYQVKEPNK